MVDGETVCQYRINWHYCLTQRSRREKPAVSLFLLLASLPGSKFKTLKRMANKKTKIFLPKYYEWMKTMDIDGSGLCCCFTKKRHQRFINAITPTLEDIYDLSNEGLSTICWGIGEKYEYGRPTFTPLRQNLVLLMAALNNEL